MTNFFFNLTRKFSMSIYKLFDFNPQDVGERNPENPISFGIPLETPTVVTIESATVTDIAVALNLVSNGDEGSTLVYINTVKADGTPNNANKKRLQDIAWALGLSDDAFAVNPNGEYERYNRDIQAKEKVQGHVLVNFVGKKLGVIAHNEHFYSKKNNDLQSRVNIFQVFNPDTLQTPIQFKMGAEGSQQELLRLANIAKEHSLTTKQTAESELAKVQSFAPTFGSQTTAPNGLASFNPNTQPTATTNANMKDDDMPF